MVNKLIIKCLLVVLIVSIVYNGCQYWDSLQAPEPGEPLPQNAISQVEIGRHEVIIKRHNKPARIIKIPKSGKIIVTTYKGNGSPPVKVHSPSWIPSLVTLPQAGLSFSNKIEPQIGLQFVRSEAFGVGLSINLTPSLVSFSIDKDILSNSYISLQYGYNKDLTKQISLRIGFFI